MCHQLYKLNLRLSLRQFKDLGSSPGGIENIEIHGNCKIVDEIVWTSKRGKSITGSTVIMGLCSTCRVGCSTSKLSKIPVSVTDYCNIHQPFVFTNATLGVPLPPAQMSYICEAYENLRVYMNRTCHIPTPYIRVALNQLTTERPTDSEEAWLHWIITITRLRTHTHHEKTPDLSVIDVTLNQAYIVNVHVS